jgi:AAA family ATP:ADP antiporter
MRSVDDASRAVSTRLLRRVVELRPGEVAPALWSAAYFFALLSGYYLLRPLREEMGIRSGVERLHWAFTATFVVMLAAVPLYSALVSRVARVRIVPLVYRAFVVQLLAFALLVRLEVSPAWVARAFFVWVSVYNLFVVSVFWSFMADVFTSEQGKRLFGFVAAGGTAGALAGPLVAALLARPLGAVGLVLCSAALLDGAARCAARVARAAGAGAPGGRLERAVGGGPLAGFALVGRSPYLLGVALQTLLVTVTSTFVYFQQARIVAAELRDPATRVALFAGVDLAVNVLGLLLQTLVTARLIAAAGLATALALHPLLTAAGLVAIAAAPTLVVLTAVQSTRRAVHYAIERPAREVLFTVVGGEEKYKAKSFLDTVVYRGGDAAAAWAQAALAGLGLAATAAAAVPLTAVWAGVAVWLAHRQRAMEVRR